MTLKNLPEKIQFNNSVYINSICFTLAAMSYITSIIQSLRFQYFAVSSVNFPYNATMAIEIIKLSKRKEIGGALSCRHIIALFSKHVSQKKRIQHAICRIRLLLRLFSVFI